MADLRWLALAACALAGSAKGAVITEVMYNPRSDEPEAEWVEIYNDGPAALDLNGWFLDDEDGSDFGAMAGSLRPGQIGIIHNQAISSSDFAAAWLLDSDVALFAVSWGSLANTPGPGDEVLTLSDATGVQRDVVDYDDAGDWPTDDGSASIYLLDPALDNQSGAHWSLSAVGVDGGRNALGINGFSVLDVGSPGMVPNATAVPEPSGLVVGILGLIGIGHRCGRRRWQARSRAGRLAAARSCTALSRD